MKNKKIVILCIPIIVVVLILAGFTMVFSKENIQKNVDGVKFDKKWNRIMAREINKNKISLTRTEYTIMRELILAPNKVVTKTRLLDLISINAENCDENSLKVHISNIRKKIRKNTQEEYIEAIWGIGYKIKK